MNLGFNWIDLAIIGILAYFIYDAFKNSFISEVLDLMGFSLALILSLSFYNFPAAIFEKQLSLPKGLSLVSGFFIIWFIFEIFFFTTIKLVLQKHIHKFYFKGEKYFSIIPAILRSLVFIAFILVLIATFPIQPQLKNQIESSTLGSFILKKAYSLERPIKNIFGGVSSDTLTFLTIKPKTSEKIDLGFNTNKTTVDTTTENMMLNLVNTERSKVGLNKLEKDDKLQQIARLHSEDMLKRGYFSHYSPENKSVADRAEKMQIRFKVIGENLAFAQSLERAHEGLMQSPGHRANILSSDYGKLGIGVIDAGIYGKMFTQVFSN